MAGVMASDSVTPTNMNPILLGLGHSGPDPSYNPNSITLLCSYIC